jgi:hypothetical protein
LQIAQLFLPKYQHFFKSALPPRIASFGVAAAFFILSQSGGARAEKKLLL